MTTDERNRNRILNFHEGEVVGGKYRLVAPPGKAAPRRPSALLPDLGRGGTGVVFLAEQQLYGTTSVLRAVKFYVYRDNIARLPDLRKAGPVALRTFQDEITNIATFNHENILKVVEADAMVRGPYAVPYLVTEYISGPTLEDALSVGTLAAALRARPSLAADLILDLCRGLSHLHAKKFYHCDIAPKNVFLQGDFPDFRAVLGDLGVGHTIPSDLSMLIGSLTYVHGSWNYMPEAVQRLYNREVTYEVFAELQPHWDLFGLAVTGLEIVEAFKSVFRVQPVWLNALQSTLKRTRDGVGCKTVFELEQRVRFLHPTQLTVWDIPELSESERGTRFWLLAVEQVATSHRVRTLTDHPAFQRLRRVPQLVMMSLVMQAGTHTRYEHSLGAYNNARRYFSALRHDPGFLSVMTPEHIETAIVAALLSNITRFPFSSMVHEIHRSDRSYFEQFSRSRLLERLNQTYSSPTIFEEIQRSFAQLNIAALERILTGDSPREDVGYRIVDFLLNSSIDVRVLDYVRRDALHLGVFPGNAFDLSDLLQHVMYWDGRLVVDSGGLSIIEQIISLRYWLYNRVYWNSPNRRMYAMIKQLLVSLHDAGKGFPDRLADVVLSEESTQETFLRLLRDEAMRTGVLRLIDLAQLVTSMRPRLFKDLLAFNHAEGTAREQMALANVRSMRIQEEADCRAGLDQHLSEVLGWRDDRIHVLLDVPQEYDGKKFGEDIDIVWRTKETRALADVSGIARGVQDSFDNHLQRLRVSLHPHVYADLESHDQLNRARQEVRAYLNC